MPIYALISIPTQLSQLDRKKGEQFADSFATAYGYGPELISALGKRGTYDNVKVTNCGKATVFFRDLNNCLGEIVNCLIQVHGTDQERCKDCIKRIRINTYRQNLWTGRESTYVRCALPRSRRLFKQTCIK